MATQSTRWPPEKIEAMKQELESDGLRTVGKRYGISGERVRQLVGNTGRSEGWKNTRARQENERKVRELFSNGDNDIQIAEKLGLSPHTVRDCRLSQGLHRPAASKRHTREHSIWCALKWDELFHYTPAVTDWNPAQAIKYGQPERAERFENFRKQFGTPRSVKIQKLFGSWSEFIRQTGLPPAPRGYRARGYWKTGRPFGQ